MSPCRAVDERANGAGADVVDTEAIGLTEIFNTDQGAQFTSDTFTGKLSSHGIQVSMDGKERWRDKVLSNGFGAA
ncbi:hypothetical protein TPL01_31320 [Sulfuriferula plumbiphila]|uniref:Integrase catalytic domain-containing protein n=1 Tax=Sulfuriferula plumbiphila TaxID=171865 RepID=A0A512LBX7_9PROT|nr:hypothetical protein SFPGR_28200 [Sulfuriferula plumbiphila]GEP31994.1 hypothetical protein TPL01_31320 [Sulfuriferula plumbiphila]